MDVSVAKLVAFWLAVLRVFDSNPGAERVSKTFS
jgi:hypothetical protein